MPPKRLIITTPTSRVSTNPTPPKPWTQVLTLDLILSILRRTLLHPWVAWICVLSLRAQVTPYTDTAFILTTTYASILSLFSLTRILNQRVAWGVSRTVQLGEEVVVVTGGASGLGLLIARIYGMRGVRVAVLDVRDVGHVEGWEEGVGVEYYRCDIGERSEVEGTLKRIEMELGTPTVLVNCAAARINGLPLLSLPSDAFQKTIRTNLLAVFELCQAFLPGMLSSTNGGTIVTVSSVLGHLSPAGLSDYSASKAGLSALHQTLEAELRVSGDGEKVKMLLVETGQMSTPLFDSIKTPSNFFAPVLEPVQVAQEIVSAIDSGKGGTIKLPTFAALATWYAVLPAGLQRLARYLSGIDYAVTKSSLQPSENEARTSEVSGNDTESEKQTDK